MADDIGVKAFTTDKPNPSKVKLSPNKHFIEYNGTSIEIPRPVNEMTENDWMRISLAPKGPLQNLVVEHQSFIGLHVVLKDKNYIPMWLYCARRDNDIPRAFDTMERAINMGAQLVSTLDDIEMSGARFELGADGHIHKDDVVLAKVPIVAYYALCAQQVKRARGSIEYQSVEGKAYENVPDMPHYVKGNKSMPIYEATEHSVEYQDRPRF